MRRRHPKRTLTRVLRTRRPLHPGRDADELDALTWPDRMRVADCMTRSPVTVHSDALIRGAADMMRTRKIRHMPVVDRGGRLVGIVTDRDLRHVLFDPAVLARVEDLREALESLTVADVMTRGVITVRRSAELGDAARLLHENKIGALPVVEGDRVVGIVTETDVLRAFADVLGQGVLARPYRWALAYR
jgi:acetoin utilization protein AcuB